MGLAICGVVLSATSSAATLMGDFRTSYICLAAPRAMFAAQLVGQLLGAVLTPMCFMLFFQTGQVSACGPASEPVARKDCGRACETVAGSSTDPHVLHAVLLDGPGECLWAS